MDAGDLPQPGRLGGLVSALVAARKRLERLLEAERTHLPLWIVVSFGAGISAWSVLPGPSTWTGWMLLCAGLAGWGTGARGRGGRMALALGLTAMLGCGWI